MKFKNVVKIITGFLSKNSPYILAGSGAAAITIGTIVIVKKAKKQEEVDCEVADRYIEEKEELNAKLDQIEDEKEYHKEYRKNIFKINARRIFTYVRYYAAPVILISGGVLCMFSATMIQTKRLKAISAAYTSLAAAFQEYRNRVKSVVGEEKEKDIFNGVVRDKDGHIVETHPLIDEKYQENTREFSRLFGDGNSPYWSKDTRLCVAHLTGAEGNCNAILREKGFITLNEVYEELGLKPSEEGMYLGWRFKYGDPQYGSTYVDLGFCGEKNANKREDLYHSWNQEIWINLIPPHTLFGKVPKEITRTEKERQEIIAKRNRIKAYV